MWVVACHLGFYIDPRKLEFHFTETRNFSFIQIELECDPFSFLGGLNAAFEAVNIFLRQIDNGSQALNSIINVFNISFTECSRKTG